MNHIALASSAFSSTGSPSRLHSALRKFLLVLSALALAMAGKAQAQTFTWSGPSTGSTTSPTSGTWDVATSPDWDGNGTSGYVNWANGTSNIAVFGGTAVGGTTITVNGIITADNLEFTSSTDNYTLSANSAQTITVPTADSEATSGGMIQLSNSANATIGNNVTVDGNGNGTNYEINGFGGVTTGTLTIANGGTVEYANASNNTNANGNLLIDGGATVIVQTGGTLSSSFDLQMDRDTGGTADTLDVNGGTVTSGALNTNTSRSAFMLGKSSSTPVFLNLNSGTINVNGNFNFAGGTNTVNLNGGVFNIGNEGGITVQGGTNAFNFNGGTLTATGTQASFWNSGAGTTVDVNGAGVGAGATGTAGGATGGAFINTGTYAIGIIQAFLHGSNGTGTTDGGLTVSGTGTLTLSGASTYNGGTVIQSGAVVIGVSNVGTITSGAIGTGTVTLGNSGNASTASLLTGGAFSASNNITVAAVSSGTLTIGGNTANTSTLSGVTTLNSSLTVSQVASGTLNLTGNITTGASAITQTLTFGNVGAVSQSTGVIGGGSGTIALTQSGTGTTTLGSAETYTGATSVTAGTLSVTGTGSLGENSGGGVSTSGTGAFSEISGGSVNGTGVTFAQGSSVTSTLSGANTYTGATTVTAGTLSVTGTGSSLTNSNVSTSGTGAFSEGSGGSVNGSGITFAQGSSVTSTLGGTNTYTGATTVSAGTLTVSGSTAGTSAVAVNGGLLNVQGGTVGGAVTVGGGTLTGSGGGTISGGVTVTTGAIDFSQDGLSAPTTLNASGLAINGGSLTFNLGSSGTDLISLGANALSGSAGSITVNIHGLVGASTSGTYNLISFGSETIGTAGNPAPVFTLGTTPAAAFTSYSLSLTGGSSSAGDLQLVVVGTPAPNSAYYTGIQATASWGANSGANTTNWSTSQTGIPDANQFPAINTDVVFAAQNATGASLSTTLNTGYAINSLTVLGTGSTSATTTNPVVIAGTGSLAINAVASATAGQNGSSVAGQGYAAGTGIVLQSGSDGLTISTTGTVVLTNSQSWTNNSGSLLSVSSNVNGSSTSGAETLTLSNTAAGGTTISGNLGNGAATLGVTVNNTSGGIATLSGLTNTFTGPIAVQNGTLAVGSLSGSNTLALGTGTPTSGIFQLGSGSTPASVAVTSLTTVGGGTGNAVVNGSSSGTSTLTVSPSGSDTFGGTLGGTGTQNNLNLTMGGAGTLILTGTNTYTGATTITSGTLQIGTGGTAGSISASSGISGNGALTFDLSSGVTQSTAISGGVSLGQAGSGTLTLTAANTYTGTTAIGTGNTIAIGATGSLGAFLNGTYTDNTVSNAYVYAGNIAINGTLNYGGSAMEVLTGAITGSTGTLIVSGTGTLTAPAVTSGTGNVNSYGNLEILSGEFSDTTAVGAGGINGAPTDFGTGTISMGSNAGPSQTAILDYHTNYEATVTNAFSINGTTTNIVQSTRKDPVFSGVVTLNTSDLTIMYNNTTGGTGSITFSGGIGGTGTVSLQANTTASGVNIGAGGVNNIGTVTNNGTVSTGTATISGTIGSNVTNVIENSAGPLVLSGANTYFGDTLVNGGTLNLTEASGTSSLAAQFSVLNIGASGNVTFGTAGVVTNQGALPVTPPTETPTVNTTSVTLGGLAGSGNLNLVNLDTTFVTTGTVTVANPTPAAVNLIIGNSNVASGNVTANPTYSGAISNSAGLPANVTMVGPNTQTFAGANTYTGTTSVSGGTLNLTGSLTGSNVSTSGTGIVTVGSGGFVAGTGTTFTQGSSGTSIFSGANTYTGVTDINTGAIEYNNSTAFGANSAIVVASGATALVEDGVNGGNNSLTLSGTGAAGMNGALDFAGTNSGPAGGSYGGQVTLLGPATISSDQSGDKFTQNGGVNLGSNTLTIVGPGNTQIATGAITGTGGLTFTGGTGILFLKGPNTYTGATTINSGTVEAQTTASVANVSGALGDNSAVTLATGATLDVMINTQIGSLTGGGNITLSNLRTLTIGGDNTSPADYTGAISGIGSDGGLTKIGTGTLSLSGTTSNTYTGPTTVSGGTLNLNMAGATAITGAGANDVINNPDVLVNGGTLTTLQNDQFASTVTINISSGSINFDNTNQTLADLYNSGGNVNYGTGSISFTDPTWTGGVNTISGSDSTVTLNVSGGTNTITGTNSGGAGSLAVSGTVNFTGTASPNVTLNSDAATPGILQLTTATTVTADGASTASITSAPGGSIRGQLDLDGNTQTFDVTAGSPNSIGLLIGADVVDSQNGTDGGVGINLTGTGILALTGNNTYTGATTISSGALELGNGGTTGRLSASSAITDNGSFIVNRSNTVTQGIGFSSAAISGTGSFTQAGTGTTILNQNNTYQGGTTVSAGTLYVNNAGGSTLPANPGETVTANNPTSSGTGSGSVTVAGSGPSAIATLAGSGTIVPGTGGVTINQYGSLSSGGSQASVTPGPGAAVTGTGLTLVNTGGLLSSILSVNNANLTFALGTNTNGSAGYLTFNNPSLNSTYISVQGDNGNGQTLGGTGEINFSGSDSVTLIDVTATLPPTSPPTATLALRQFVPYLLVAAGTDNDYYGLVTSLTNTNSDLTLDGNGYVMGVYDGSGALTNYTQISMSEENINLAQLTPPQAYYAQLYLFNGDLEVVPEPSTWALMLGGLAVLIFIQQRRRRDNN